MNSPPHRANILGRSYNAIGVGVVRKGRNWYCTEDFAHSFAAVSADQVAGDVMQAVARLRQRQNLAPLHSVRLQKLDSLACRHDADVQSLLHSFPDSHSAVVFTTWNPEQLPNQMTTLATSKQSTAVALRACPLPAETGGAGGYKIAAIFF